MLVIVDYNLGNHRSILNMLKKAGVPVAISSSIRDIENAEKLILPGVGAFDNGMINLQEMGLVAVLTEKVLKQQTPILGICLGMQLLVRRSEEGRLPGLGWIKGEVVRFLFNPMQNGLKIPHMGWNSVNVMYPDALFKGLEEARFYFVHSYHVLCEHQEDVVATTHYGYNFVSSFRCSTIIGTQFHPEKSHTYGLRLLKNFIELN